MQYDVVSLQARDLLAVFLPHCPREDQGPAGRLGLRLLAESLEATLFSRLYRNVLLEIFGHEQGIGWRRMIYLCTRVGFSTMVLTAIDRLLLKERFAVVAGARQGRADSPRGRALSSEEDQPWTVTNAFSSRTAILDGRFVGRAFGFHTGEMAMPGCHATPFSRATCCERLAARRRSLPSYHFVTDLGSDEAWTNLPGGPSESRVSGYYKNDIPRWSSGQYKPLDPQA